MLRPEAVTCTARSGSTIGDQPPLIDRPVLRSVVVPYSRFRERRELRCRVIAALTIREQEFTIDAEFRTVEPVGSSKTLDETS